MSRKLSRHERDAVARMRAALLDLSAAQRYTESNELLDLIERIDPPAATAGEAAGSGSPVSRAGSSEAAAIPPVAAPPGTSWRGRDMRSGFWPCSNCGETLPRHCTVHLIPCCPGSLMNGQDEGTWTPSAAGDH